VSPAEICGEAWVPTLKDFKRYLKYKGFHCERPGKGDHEIWQATDGRHVAVNASHRDKKHVDIASVRQLAEFMGVSFGDLVSNIVELTSA